MKIDMVSWGKNQCETKLQALWKKTVCMELSVAGCNTKSKTGNEFGSSRVLEARAGTQQF